jgi:hypothetical protein
LSFLLTPWNRVLEKLMIIQLVKLPTFYGAQMFITLLKRPCLRPCVTSYNMLISLW